jgi:hypothetical protein
LGSSQFAGLVPASLIGIGTGWLFAAKVSEAFVHLNVGLISLGFVVYMIGRERGGHTVASSAKMVPGIFWGALAGFTTFASHALAPTSDSGNNVRCLAGASGGGRQVYSAILGLTFLVGLKFAFDGVRELLA